MDARDWIELGVFLLASVGSIIAAVRYIDNQIAEIKLGISKRTVDVDRLLSDKLSIGEYNRRHDDLEKRIRLIERWQDHANGRARFYYPDKDEPSS